ncbi:MAG: endolytic transglycosylase MltG [Chloroflexi bacterium]|nr:endolytic transglycosylase MltG [Chloroflexota bacterium]
MSRLLKLLLLVGVVLLVLVGLAFGALMVISGGQPINYVQTAIIKLSLQSRYLELDQPYNSDPTSRRFTVNPGDTPREIATNLYNAELIRDVNLFVDYVRAYDIDVQLQAGTYFLKRSQSIRQIASTLTDSRNSQIVFSIIEGWRMEEVAEAVDHNPLFGFSGTDFLNVVGAGAVVDPAFAQKVGLPPAASLEGFLFPNTYSLPPDVTPEQLRDTLLAEFSKETDAAGIPEAAASENMSIFQVVTLGSIVQREAVHLDEGPQIAGVYMNRLTQNMTLDADPTVQYALGHAGDWWPQITQADYTNTVSPYNVYLNFGLPPGPIANPGLAAILSAAHPQASDFLYFQADCSGNGYHRFAKTFAEHLANSCS